MNTTELKNRAEAAINSDTVALPFARAEFHEAANPAAILKLLAINAELVGALKWIKANPHAHYMNTAAVIDVVVSKAEGGDL